jgi:hypothetical protein
LVGKPEGLRTLGRSRHRWKDNIKMYLREIGLESGLDSSGSEYKPVAGSCERGNELSCSIKGGELERTISFSRRILLH